MRALTAVNCLLVTFLACCQAADASPPPAFGAVQSRQASKTSHYYVPQPWPGKGYGWWGNAARRWGGYGPLGTGAYRGYGYGFNNYPVPYRAYNAGYPQNVLGPANVGNGYVVYSYFGEGYPGWKYWPGRVGQTW